MKLLVIVIAVLAAAAADRYYDAPIPKASPVSPVLSKYCGNRCGVKDTDPWRCFLWENGIGKGREGVTMCDCKDGYYRGTEDGFKTKHGNYCHKIQEADGCENACGENMECFKDESLGYYCDCKDGYVRGGENFKYCILPTIYKIQCGSENCKEGYFRGTKDGTKKENGEFCHKVVPDPCNNECHGENMECVHEASGGLRGGRYVCRCNLGYEDVGKDVADCSKEAKVYECSKYNNCKDCKAGYYRSSKRGMKIRPEYSPTFCTKTRNEDEGDCGDWFDWCPRYKDQCPPSRSRGKDNGLGNVCKETCVWYGWYDRCQKQE